jgi:hypothetical protein
MQARSIIILIRHSQIDPNRAVIGTSQAGRCVLVVEKNLVEFNDAMLARVFLHKCRLEKEMVVGVRCADGGRDVWSRRVNTTV